MAAAADSGGGRTPGERDVTASGQVKLKPGDTIGILGGGQLGRMLALAAARLGLRVRCFRRIRIRRRSTWCCNATCAEYADVEALELFAADVDVITYEFENVPAATAMVLSARRPVLPNHKVLEITRTGLRKRTSSTVWASPPLPMPMSHRRRVCAPRSAPSACPPW
jgi:5-(carboxyamino)imidazole ribonucleotide synthase